LNPDKDEYDRFNDGIPPEKNGDYAFLLHIISSLKSTGKGAVILPHGVLFRGNVERQIRKAIIKQGFIKSIIGLPANLFYGTSIPACIIVPDKENATSRKGIFMIDASKGFIKDGNKNRLRSQDIHKIVDIFTKQLEVPAYSRLVLINEITNPKNDYNLNLPRYIDSNENEDIHDLTAHLKGGIPKQDINDLESYWRVFKTVRRALFKGNGQSDPVTARINSSEVKAAILDSEDYKAYTVHITKILHQWEKRHENTLKKLKIGSNPKDLINEISEDLLQRFANVDLLDKYDAYQYLMVYWSKIMQDDVCEISIEGWIKMAEIQHIIDVKKDDKNQKTKEHADIVIGSGKKARKFKTEYIPPNLIIDRYYTSEKQAIEALRSVEEPIKQQIEELLEVA